MATSPSSSGASGNPPSRRTQLRTELSRPQVDAIQAGDIVTVNGAEMRVMRRTVGPADLDLLPEGADPDSFYDVELELVPT